MDEAWGWPTRLVLIGLGAAVGAAYGFYTKPIPVPRTGSGMPVTQIAAQKALLACDACNALRPTLTTLGDQDLSISSPSDILDIFDRFT